MEKNIAIHTLARAIILNDNHILLAHHPKWRTGHYYLPGGHIEHGESAQQSLYRELREEMGLSFEIGNFLGCLEYSFEPNLGTRVCHTHEYNFLFTAQEASLVAQKKPPQVEENVTFSWIPMADLSGTNLLPQPLINLIPHWLTHNASQNFVTEMKQR